MTHLLRNRAAAALLVAGVVGFSLATGYIHLSLGSTTSLMGLLFLANAAGFAGLALAFAVAATARHRLIERFSWAPRLALAGFSALTIIAYLVTGPYFALGWITKAIELAIIALLGLDVLRVYGGPAGLIRAAAVSLRGDALEVGRDA